jgi:hypothetical protein
VDRLYLAIAALVGGLIAALLGWMESNESFNPRKFGGSAVRALLAGAIFAAGYEYSSSVGALDLFYAFLGGAGVDVIGNRIAGKFGNGGFPISLGTNKVSNAGEQTDTAGKEN